MPFRLLSLLVLLAAFIAGAARPPGPPDPGRPDPSEDELWPGTGRWARAVLDTLTLEEKVGQLFAVRVYGRFRSEDDPEHRRLADLVERFGIGGMVFFQGDPYAQAALTNAMQRRAPLPLLVAQDAESGVGMRIVEATELPTAMALSATGDASLAYAAGRVTAAEARALGVHQVYAPVADVNNNPSNPIINVRSFGERPERVAEMAAAFANGLRDGGVLATAKHFPGHGDTETDSHAGLPSLPFSRTRLDTLELVPFRRLIGAGVQSVMTGHLALPLLEPDPRVSATLSPRIVDDLLRRELGFSGLIVTDALDMRGVTGQFDAREIALLAVEAGADMLLLSEDVEAARTAIVEAVRTRRFSEARIDRSVMRILRAKEWARLHRTRQVPLDALPARIATNAHLAVRNEIARRSLTLLRNEGEVLPFRPGGSRLLVVLLSDREDEAPGADFLREIRARWDPGDVTAVRLGPVFGPEAFDQVLLQAKAHDVVVAPAFVRVRDWSGQIDLPERHRSLLDSLNAGPRPLVLLSFGNPYLVRQLAPPDAYLAAYGDGEASQRAAVEVLFGESAATGRLPVSIPGRYPVGAGLDLPKVALRPGLPEEVGMDGRRLSAVDSLIRASIRDRAFPGAAVAVGRDGVLVHLAGYGYHTYAADRPVTPVSRFDLASVTKVVATTTAAMKLYEEGRLDLDAPAARYLPEFGRNGKERLTVRQLLTHTAGLEPYYAYHRLGLTDRDAVLEHIYREPVRYTPGAESRYSDLGIITLGIIVERITGLPLDRYVRETFFEPLGMYRTGFRPAGGRGIDPDIVPTEVDETFRRRLVQGEVHDETAYILGGTAGHAGLFSTAADLARFAQMLLDGGTLYGRRFLRPETIRLFTTPSDPSGRHTRALGWDTKPPTGYTSAGQLFGPRSFGHTGFTGTSIWFDPDQRLFVILLTNRVFPTRENRRISEVRPKLADAAYRSIVGPPELLPLPPP